MGGYYPDSYSHARQQTRYIQDYTPYYCSSDLIYYHTYIFLLKRNETLVFQVFTIVLD
jgi:hypothetical protein